eukprot:g18997.t1
MDELQEENRVDEALGLDNVPLDEEEDWNAGADMDLAAAPRTDSGSEALQSEQSAASSQSAPGQHTQETAEEPHHQSLRDTTRELFEQSLLTELVLLQQTIHLNEKEAAKAKQAAHSTTAKTTQQTSRTKQTRRECCCCKARPRQAFPARRPRPRLGTPRRQREKS